MVEKKYWIRFVGYSFSKIQLLDGKRFKRSFYHLILFKTAFSEFGYKHK